MSSSYEQAIEAVLKKDKVRYSCEQTFPDLTTKNGKFLRFDFAIYDDALNLRYLIEVQGQQHYRPVDIFGGEDKYKKQQYNDERKRRYCLVNNIRLLPLAYTMVKDIKSIKDLDRLVGLAE